jgi:hypothetical protein
VAVSIGWMARKSTIVRARRLSWIRPPGDCLFVPNPRKLFQSSELWSKSPKRLFASGFSYGILIQSEVLVLSYFSVGASPLFCRVSRNGEGRESKQNFSRNLCDSAKEKVSDLGVFHK